LSDNDDPTVSEVLNAIFQRFESAGLFYGHGTDNAWDEATFLVLHCLDLPLNSSTEVLEYRINREVLDTIHSLVEVRVIDRVPLPYITAVAWFAGMGFKADRRAIIPRSPIAELIENNFQPWYSGAGPEKMLDLCCGGGCIGVASAALNSQLHVDLVDLDTDALALAEENIAKHGVETRVKALQSDLFSALEGKRYDLIVSNPPYVDIEDLASMPEEYHHEPGLALGSGVDGLDLTRKILQQAAAHLLAHGLLVLEVGNSGRALEEAFPSVPFTWVDFERGGHGVFVMSKKELQLYRESFF